VIPDDHPLVPELNELSGDEAFYLLVFVQAECLSILRAAQFSVQDSREADRQENPAVLCHRHWGQLSSVLLRNGDQS
jgi:hypothetical protein